MKQVFGSVAALQLKSPYHGVNANISVCFGSLKKHLTVCWCAVLKCKGTTKQSVREISV